ncbi:MAG TPA: enoyl-CoA hydratase-related protein [Chloroflexota bacterium]|nr:enoyl-CoA hydratase-related protein [Chloroflexota bacterium]
MSIGSYTQIRVEQEGGILWVRLNRPRVYNAIDGAMMEELARCFGEVGGIPGIRVLALSGEGPAFCAGADLDWMRTVAGLGMAENLDDAGLLADLLSALNSCPVPTVARAHGVIFGGGIGLLAACDVVVAADDARFSLSEVKLGLLPAAISPFVIAKIGQGHARALFSSGTRFDAARALRIGLVHQIAPAAELDAAMRASLKDFLTAAPRAAAQARALINRVTGRTPTEARAETTQLIADLRAGPEGREGIAAFLEKRKPAWIEDGGS